MSDVYTRSNDIVTRKVAGETILVPIHQKASDMENIYILNEVGSRMWELLDGKRNIVDIGGILVKEFEAAPAEIEKDLINFFSSLKKVSLVKSLTG